MSLSEVQARTAEIELRLRSLGLAGTRPAAGTLGLRPDRTGSTTTGRTDGGAATSAPDFEAALEAATGGGPSATTSRSGTATRPGVSWSHVGGDARTTGEQVVRLARQHLGTPYVWGGESPGGFDCSGLVQWAYQQVGVDLPRVSTDQARAGRAVTAAEARPGDLVFFERGTVDHIGIYAGSGTWVVAPKRGDVVKVQDVDLSKATTIRRVLPDTAAGVPAARVGEAASPDWAARLPAAGRRFTDEIAAAAKRSGVDPRLISAVAWSESGFDPTARSGAGALGLMQLMPRTAQGLGVDPLDARQSLDGGSRYLAENLSRFGGSTELALAAYNAGPTAVRRHGGVPPYEETQRYVATVLQRFRALGGTA